MKGLNIEKNYGVKAGSQSSAALCDLLTHLFRKNKRCRKIKHPNFGKVRIRKNKLEKNKKRIRKEEKNKLEKLE
ncbi:hypothetical protein [uncultured Anaerococcus sp.]|uniref:hypothetical protein n=1 Tax=uncultured Anaerococcus sp. TaxID=293428 RepID=UPI00288B0C8F|nr:hypothetical protein [uncultured Anaerococcus sp.]